MLILRTQASLNSSLLSKWLQPENEKRYMRINKSVFSYTRLVFGLIILGSTFYTSNSVGLEIIVKKEVKNEHGEMETVEKKVFVQDHHNENHHESDNEQEATDVETEITLENKNK